ncbi:hypothetical protein JI735_14460 [Paenibacillus sonchi]|uniref:Amidase domain-containing protein n=1 Tax=Paenibacillus sonchi TaxID=373687 RepID=A0A974PGF4_9BACL|nr:hypothetical protein [Paenibacillus sonchi]MCE3199077.1 hypothetical protein [Paenibacillus sonchi]QQZ63544.1 hypothetical protein JI735_14460 [Paenibacillus sonchi]
MKKNLLTSISLCFSLIFCLALPAAFADSTSAVDETTNVQYSITNSYEYVVKPNTDEWKKFTSTEEKVNASQIPQTILNKMTTKALVETVLKYPLLANMFAFNTKQEGFNAIYSNFNGLQELTKRTDAISELEQYQDKIGYLETTDNTIIAQGLYVKALLEALGSNSLIGSNSDITPYYTNSSVTTPNGTSVSTYKGLTWADHGLTATEASALQAQMVKAYPNATVVSSQNPSYNCHSYAWYSTSSTNTHWMNSASAYRTDGSYTSGTGAVGSKVDYGAGDHSGIVTYVGGGSGPNVKVKSKWGIYGVFTHNIVDCPYTIGSYSCTFWN